MELEDQKMDELCSMKMVKYCTAWVSLIKYIISSFKCINHPLLKKFVEEKFTSREENFMHSQGSNSPLS